MAHSFSILKHWAGREITKASVFLFALLILSFLPFVAGDRTLLESSRQAASIMPNGAWTGRPLPMAFARTKDPGAPAWVVEPLLELIRYQYLHEGAVPLWNPYQAFGTPLAANMQSQVFYPLTIALSMDHSPRARNWYVLCRLYILGICAFLYARLFVSFIPALAAGVTSMFGGYYILYLTMPHLSVEVLLPALLLSGEHLVRNPRFRSLTWFSLVVFGVIAGGMPESSFLLLALTFTYLPFRLVTDASLHPKWRKRTGWLICSTCFGLGFAGILLFPFRQFMRYSFDNHQFLNTGSITGKTFDAPGLSFFTYFFPLIYGPGWDNNLRNYVGLTSIFLALVALLSTLGKKRYGDRALTFLTWFFAALVVGIWLKRYGLVISDGIGSLPIFSLVLFPKYQEPLLSFSISMLCAVGLERIGDWRFSCNRHAVALGLTFSIVPIAIVCSKAFWMQNASGNLAMLTIGLWSILLPTALLMLLALMLINAGQQRANATSQGPVRQPILYGVLGILVCESLLSYFTPTYYLWNSLPSVRDNPYAGAPYIELLRKSAGLYRIFGEDDVLFPDWPSAFQMFDIRNLDAMYYKKFFPFVQEFFPSKSHKPGEDMYDRFTGSGRYQFDSFLERRLLQLSSVKYILTMPGTAFEENIVDEILKQNAGRLTPGRENLISKQTLSVGGETRVALGEHPPYLRLPYLVKIEKGKEHLEFSYGINPAAFSVCGDGAEFVIETRDSHGTVRKAFSSYVDPGHETSLRRWLDGAVDLSPYLGQNIEILLSTNGGPKGDVCADWAVWSKFRFDSSSPSGPFKPIYRKEVNIFEYASPLPRAVIYHEADVMPSEPEVLKHLTLPTLDVSKTVSLNRSALTNQQVGWVETLNGAEADPSSEKAYIKSYKSQRVVIETNLNKRGILVLNDSDYPGWTVNVDGSPKKLVTANYLFRGVLLEPGRHIVEFIYAPASVKTGAAISISSLISFLLFGTWRARRKITPRLPSYKGLRRG